MSAAPPRISQPTTSLAAGARAPEIESWGRKVVSRNVWTLSRVERFRLYSYLLVRFIGSHLYLLKPVRSISNTITAANCTNEGGTVSKLFPARLQQGRRNWNAWVAAKEDDRKVSSMGMQLFGRHLRQSHMSTILFGNCHSVATGEFRAINSRLDMWLLTDKVVVS